MDDFKYEIVEKVATLSEKNGWTKELNIVKYGESNPVWDIRSWCVSEDGLDRKMSKGVTLKPDEMKKLAEALKNIDNFEIKDR